MQILLNLLKGVAIGLANIIPGVSGGTMALVLGIYQRLITAIGNLGLQTVTSSFRGRRAFLEEMRRIDALFLGTLGVGAILTIVAVARLMTYLLEQQHNPTYGFFFGLVLVSVVVPYRLVRKKNLPALGSCAVAIALVVGLTLAMSGQQRLESARHKAALKARAASDRQPDAASPTAAASFEGRPGERAIPSAAPAVSRDAGNMVFFFVAGIVAISAMILPGISGSFMLLLMGVYFDVLACINERELIMLGIFAAGCLLGLLAFTRLLKFLLSRFHDMTMAFLLGLVLGSLWAIWPFKSFGLAGGKRVDMDNIWPAALGINEALTLGAALVGGAIVAVFIWIELRQERDAP